MKQAASIRHLLHPLQATPFHPQWHAFKNSKKTRVKLGKLAQGTVLDIGAGEMGVGKHLSAECDYISLDYYETAKEWYGTRPSLFGDGQMLPVADNSVDTVFVLDVLEHLPRPDACVAEIHRVLRPGGKVMIQVPFLYPLHDEPYDFQRWTTHGLKLLAERHSFSVDVSTCNGHPLETAALLMNVALCKSILNWIRAKNPLLLLSPLIVPLIPVINIFGWLLATLGSRDDFMPQGYQAVWNKPA